jgi:hypothetical protein
MISMGTCGAGDRPDHFPPPRDLRWLFEPDWRDLPLLVLSSELEMDGW